MTRVKDKPDMSKKLKIIPLGGLGEIGLNIMAYEYADKIIVVDCGLMFPESHMPGIDLVHAISSRHWCDEPSAPTDIPAWVATILTFSLQYPMVFLIWSKVRPMANTAKELAKTVFPVVASPAAQPIMFCSATPILKNLLGNFSANFAVIVDLERSASSTTIS